MTDSSYRSLLIIIDRVWYSAAQNSILKIIPIVNTKIQWDHQWSISIGKYLTLMLEHSFLINLITSLTLMYFRAQGCIRTFRHQHLPLFFNFHKLISSRPWNPALPFYLSLSSFFKMLQSFRVIIAFFE